MSDNNFKIFDDEVMSSLEKLKAKYSDVSGYSDDDDEILPRHKREKSSEKQQKAEPPVSEAGDASDEENTVYEEAYGEEADSGFFTSAVEYEESVNDSEAAQKPKKKNSKALTIALAVLIAAVLWGMLFGIDMVLASELHKPVFCIKTAEFENGSKNYTGLFYKYQYNVADDGTVTAECLPWFGKGLNSALENAEKDGKTVNTAKEEPDADDLKTIEIKIPAEFIEGDTSKGVKLTDEQIQQGFEDVTFNKKEHYATYKIKNGDYSVYLDNLKKTVSENISSLAGSEDYPSIKKAEFSNGFSTVTLYVDKKLYEESLDHFIDQSIFEWVGRYKSFANEVPTCDLIIKNAEDNSIIEESKG